MRRMRNSNKRTSSVEIGENRPVLQHVITWIDIGNIFEANKVDQSNSYVLSGVNEMRSENHL